MHFVEKEPAQKRFDFVQKLKSKKILRVPGAYNPLTAKLIEEIGYDAVYVSGGVMANDLGFPDIGLTTLQDVSTRSYLISRVTNLPTIVDIDTGFKSCKETIETFEQFGISAVHLEDQIERKRCGHLDNKELISTDAMVKKIKECVSAKKDKNFKIIARSDAKSVEGIDKMIERCKAYIDAGAEIVFPEALSDEKDFEKVRKELSCYLLANMTEFGKSKLFNYKELEQLGYNIVIYPVTTQRLAMKNVEDGLRDIYANGHQNNIIDKMQTRKRCGHLDNKELISTDAMVKKIKECVSAKKDENFKIIARSDAKSVEGIDKMIDRCKAYVDAGAEIIFPEALENEKDFEKVRKELSCYLLANMTEFGKSKLFNYKELENFGYNIVIYPVTTQRLAMKNVEDGLRDIYVNGHQNNIIDKMQTRKRLYELVDYEKYNSLDEKIYNFSTKGHE